MASLGGSECGRVTRIRFLSPFSVPRCTLRVEIESLSVNSDSAFRELYNSLIFPCHKNEFPLGLGLWSAEILEFVWERREDCAVRAR